MYQVIPAPFVENIIVSSLNNFNTFVKKVDWLYMYWSISDWKTVISGYIFIA